MDFGVAWTLGIGFTPLYSLGGRHSKRETRVITPQGKIKNIQNPIFVVVVRNEMEDG